jgi:multicomponent Na+:H+ antiporter subunit F
MIVNIVITLIMLSIILMIINAVISTKHASKIISLHSITSYTIALSCLLAVTNSKNFHFVDVAIIYALISMVATVAILKYTKEKKGK